MIEDRVDEIIVEMDKLVVAKSDYIAGYRAGYNAAKKRSFGTHENLAWRKGG